MMLVVIVSFIESLMLDRLRGERSKKEEEDHELSMNERISGLTIDSKSIIKVQNLL